MKTGCVAKKSSGSTMVEYKNLRLNDETYSVGDIVVIKEYNDDCCFGTLIRIWKEKDKPDPYARVRWFYKPSDVFETEYDFISQAELFDSDHEQDIWVVCLYSKAKIMSFEDYHDLDEAEEDVFFTRAKYFHKEKVLRPGFEEWKRACVCNDIINPDNLYVACENCSDIYHPECIGFLDVEDQPFICQKCNKNT